MSLFHQGMGRRGRRTIRKPEYQPEESSVWLAREERGLLLRNELRMKYGIPASEGVGVFLFEGRAGDLCLNDCC
jgi:hypothetical protein